MFAPFAFTLLFSLCVFLSLTRFQVDFQMMRATELNYTCKTLIMILCLSQCN